ncbi:MAG: hypothetical protein ABIM20_04645 [candidate division WOR-3 bacterium]
MKRVLKAILLMWILAGLSSARPAVEVKSSKVYHVPIIDGSELCMYISNYGMFGHNPAGGSGGWWPRNRRNETYIYGAGVWVGALKRNVSDPSKWDTVVTFFYNPNSGQSEGAPAFVPTLLRDSTGRHIIIYEPDYRDFAGAIGSPQARVYLSNSDNAGYGWPIKEVTQSGDTVDFVLSTLDSYTRYTDLNPSRQETGSKPLGILVDQWTYQFDVPGLKDITFLMWQVKNISGDTLKDVYISACYDDDIGNESGQNANDLVGFLRSYDFGEGPVMLNLAFQYQLVPEGGWIGVDGRGLPGVIGSVFLESPIATKEVVIWDTIGTHVGPDTVRPGEPLGMTAFKIFTLQIDPKNDIERYILMSGYDPVSAGGRYNPFMDDVYGPGDKRFIQVSGPFDMPPNAEARLVVAAVIAKDTANIKYVAKKAVEIYTANFIAPQPPAKPTLYAWGRDKEVVLYWDNKAEITRDRFYDIEYSTNPMYREYDFEGYILRRSMDGMKWDTLGRWDLPNEFTVIYTDSVRNYLGQVVYTDSIVLGTNTGLVHSYVDKDPILRNGVRYIYEIIPYDINYSSGTWFSLTGPAGRALVVPHKNPVNEVFGTITVNKYGLENTFGYDYAAVVSKDPRVLVPGKYYIRFKYEGPSSRRTDLPTSPAYPLYSVYLVSENGDTLISMPSSKIFVVIDSTGKNYSYVFPTDFAFKGVVISNPAFKMITDLSNSYFTADTNIVGIPTTTWKLLRTLWTYDSTLNLYKQGAKSRGAYFAGSVYKITWRHEDFDGDGIADSVTLEVIDTLTGLRIPFDPVAGRDSIAVGWSFVAGNGAPAALRFKAIERIPVNATTGLARYLLGIRLPGSDLMRFADFTTQGGVPADGTEWYIGTLAPSNVSRIPYDTDYYEITVTGVQTLSQYNLDNVKVVPNPYYVLTPLDRTKDIRIGGVRFINLPKNATIRIYNPAGELIKIIEVTPENDGEYTWNLLTEYGVRPASGIYMYHITTPEGYEKVGKLAVIF